MMVTWAARRRLAHLCAEHTLSVAARRDHRRRVGRRLRVRLEP